MEEALQEHNESDEGSFEAFLKEYLHSVKTSHYLSQPVETHDHNQVKQSCKHKKHQRSKNVNQRDSNRNRSWMTKSSSAIPYLKFFILRGSHNRHRMVEFREYQDTCYRSGKSDDKDCFYTPYLVSSLDTFDHEINELARILKDWLDKIMMPYMDQSQFDNLVSTIRYGHAYLTKLSPYVDQMSVADFKKRFNHLSPYIKAKNLPYYMTTGFYPVYDNLECDNDDNSNFQLLTFDTQRESYRVAFSTDYGSYCHYYADFDSQLELILNAEDVKYFNVDIKNAPRNPDIRICFSTTDTTNPQPFASKLQAYTHGKSPILKRNSHTGAMAISKDYVSHVKNVRHKKQKIYKLTDSNELWDDFRRATVVKIVTIIEYMNIDMSTGEFKEIHKKNEITIDTPLNDLLSHANCQRLAENLLKLSIDLIPNCLS